MNSLELYIGLVGPNSYAEDIQKWVHEALDAEEPPGWDNQLKHEPVIGFIYENKRKMLRYDVWNQFGVDSSIHYGGGIGTAYIYGNGGMNVRTGLNLPYDFGTCRIMPVSCNNAVFNVENPSFLQRHQLGFYLFFSVDVRIVLRDIFLDGNTFQDSHSVEKEPVVADFMAGAVLIFGRFRMSMARVLRTKQFETQQASQEYVSANISIKY